MRSKIPTTPIPDKAYIKAKMLAETLARDILKICQRCGGTDNVEQTGEGDFLCYDCQEHDTKERYAEY